MNRANEEIKLPDGRTIWLSRSPAIVAIVLIYVGKDLFVLTEKRSDLMDEPKKWSAPSGYLDWNESGFEAVQRELLEETSFDITAYEEYLDFDNNKQPFYVHTDPWTDAKQNISLTYVLIYNMKKLPLHIEDFKDKEIDKIKWMNVNDLEKIDTSWAFNHDERIMMAINKFNL